MFAIYNNVTRGSPTIFFFVFIHLPTTYLSLAITLLVLLLQLCLLILSLWVFLRNQLGESSKQGIEVAWCTPIHHVKWWISRFRGVCRTYAASEVELFVILVALRPLNVTESSIFYAVRVLNVFHHFIIIIIIIVVVVITVIINIILITFIFIRSLGFSIKTSLMFLWGKLKVYVCFPQFLYVS